MEGIMLELGWGGSWGSPRALVVEGAVEICAVSVISTPVLRSRTLLARASEQG